MIRRQLIVFAIALLVFASCFTVGASAQVPESAPAPASIGLAKTAFYSFTGSPINLGSANVKLVYDSVYRALRKNGNYKLVGVPNDADIFWSCPCKNESVM